MPANRANCVPSYRYCSNPGKGRTGKLLFLFAVAAILSGNTGPREEPPMLWETAVETVSVRIFDARRDNPLAGKAGEKNSALLCLRPFKPKVGKIPSRGQDCAYKTVRQNGSRIFRKRVCKTYPEGTAEIAITGTETATAYSLRLITTLRDGRGNKTAQSVARETGTRLGKCPP